MNVLYISNILWKFHSNRLNACTLNIQESFKHAWHCGIGFLRCLAAKVLNDWGSTFSQFIIWIYVTRREKGGGGEGV